MRAAGLLVPLLAAACTAASPRAQPSGSATGTPVTGTTSAPAATTSPVTSSPAASTGEAALYAAALKALARERGLTEGSTVVVLSDARAMRRDSRAMAAPPLPAALRDAIGRSAEPALVVRWVARSAAPAGTREAPVVALGTAERSGPGAHVSVAYRCGQRCAGAVTYTFRATASSWQLSASSDRVRS